jgi:hypothetical protein
MPQLFPSHYRQVYILAYLGAAPMTKFNYGSMTNNELETLFKNAINQSKKHPDKARLLEAESVAEEVNQELTRRKKRKLEARKNTGNSADLVWRKTDPHTNVLFYNGQMIAKIILVANHSLTNRDVYNAYVFEKLLPSSFEYIGPARIAVTEKVEQMLARGEGILPNTPVSPSRID